MEFRHDINALRALAVSLVILFHFHVPGFTGGFVGVDIFLVLSGYLMTRIIVTGLDNGTFRFSEFFQARARRIVPALLALCAALLVFGFLYLPTDEYRSLVRELKSSVLFYSNIKLANSDGYFATPPSEQWLLHTWSLSVEWQFYMLYPFVLYSLHKLSPRRYLGHAIVLLMALSYCYSIYLTPQSPNDAFYLLPTRAAELLAGGVIYFIGPISKRFQGVALWSGLALIALCGVLLSEKSAWPGYLMALPVIGTALVLLAASNLPAFRNSQVQYLGNISYSAYLWHWPIVVLFYFCGLLESPIWVAAGISLSIICAGLSYRYVECRFKNSTNTHRSLAKYFAAALVIVITSTGVASATSRYPEIRPVALWQDQPKYTSDLYKQKCAPNPYKAADCLLGSGEIGVVLFGDSHAQSHAAAVQVNNKGAAIEWALGGCPTILNVSMKDKKTAENCQGFIREKLRVLESQYQGVPVVLFNHYALYLSEQKISKYHVSIPPGHRAEKLSDYYASQFEPIVCSIRKSHPVFLVRPTPEMPFNPHTGVVLQKRLLHTDNEVSVDIEEHRRINADANKMIDQVADRCGAKIIDPTELLCLNGKCLGTLNMKPLYFDDNHLIDAGNMVIQSLFRTVFPE